MIIVTGGAGFIGSNLVANLLEEGHKDIVVIDWLGDEDKWKNLRKAELRDFVMPEDTFEYLEEYKDQIDVIFHMGAISATTEKDADLIMESNFILTRDLWRFCARNNVRFIYASSAATYGDGENGFKDDADCESLSKLLPLNGYGWSKHLTDRCFARILKDKSEPVPPQHAGLKFFNVYGPNEHHKDDMMSVICKLYPQVVAGEKAKLFKSHHPDYEDGGQLRDFVYVKDCVDVMLWLFKSKKVSGLFNVGTGKARSFKDLAESTFKAAGKKPNIQYIPMPEHLRGKYQYFTQADMSKLKKAGYDKPFTELEEGINDYVQNYLMNESDPYR